MDFRKCHPLSRLLLLRLQSGRHFSVCSCWRIEHCIISQCLPMNAFCEVVKVHRRSGNGNQFTQPRRTHSIHPNHSYQRSLSMLVMAPYVELLLLIVSKNLCVPQLCFRIQLTAGLRLGVLPAMYELFMTFRLASVFWRFLHHFKCLICRDKIRSLFRNGPNRFHLSEPWVIGYGIRREQREILLNERHD